LEKEGKKIPTKKVLVHYTLQKKKKLWSPLIKLPGSIPASLHFLFGRGTNLNLDLKISKTNAINLHPINIPCDWGHWIKSTGNNFFVKLF
jgi:hypothetical protein